MIWGCGKKSPLLTRVIRKEDSLPYWKRPIGKMMLKRMVGKYGFEEGYNIQAAKLI